MNGFLWLVWLAVIIGIAIWAFGCQKRLRHKALLQAGPLSDEDLSFLEDHFDLYKKIPEFKLQNYNMNIQEFKVIFWWEWAHRFLGRLIGITYLVPLI